MNLLRIGRNTLNMDQALSIYDADDEFIVRFGRRHGDPHEVVLTGDDYAVFAEWLDLNALYFEARGEG